MSDKEKLLDFEKPILELETRIQELRSAAREGGVESLFKEISELEVKLVEAQRELAERLTAWQRTQLARHALRPGAFDLATRIFDDILELHGDRSFGDDAAINVSMANLKGREVLLLGHIKGRETNERVKHNFGMAHPEGYRKVIRLIEFAESFKKPVISLIDTPGAYPGIGAEERGQAWVIADAIEKFMKLEVPTISVVVGEGGSGGALAVGVADRVYMLENAIYSVISPEGCASILFRDAIRAPEAAAAMKITARHAESLGVIDGIIEEPPGGAHRDWDDTAKRLSERLISSLEEISKMNTNERLAKRYEKFRKIGIFHEAES